MYKLAIDLPNSAPGAEVSINGLGVFENGREYEIDDDRAEAYRLVNQVQTSTTDKDGAMTVSTEPGPTLLEAFKSHPGIKVTTVKEKKTAEEGAK